MWIAGTAMCTAALNGAEMDQEHAITLGCAETHFCNCTKD